MFKRAFLIALLTLAIAAPVALADEDDGIMGIYKHAENPELLAKVMALGDGKYKAQIIQNDQLLMPVTHGRLSDGVVDLTFDADESSTKDVRWEPKIADGRLSFRSGTGEGRVVLERTIVEPPTLGQERPEGGVVLFDGKNLDHWQRWPEKWNLVDGAMEVVGSNLVTKREFGDATYHIEFMCPFMPKAREQARGNSGVYIQGRYEVQVLDSFGEEPNWKYCGGIYEQAVPLTNASLPPLTWQTYDIDFTAPRFDDDGNKTANARITVRHNGILIHDDVELTAPTKGGMGGPEAPRGRLQLQDHNDRVRFRNIWVVPK